MWPAFLLFVSMSLFLYCSICFWFYLKRRDGYLLLSPMSHRASPCSESSSQFNNEVAASSQKYHVHCQESIKKKKRSGFACRERRKERATLPGDIWIEILLRLPRKSLMRCKCVCKSWHCLISDSGFILRHLSQYTCNPEVLNPLLLANMDRFSFISLDDNGKRIGDDDSMSVIDVASFIDPSNLCSELGLSYEGHCHGIICLCDHFSKSGLVALWNPTTREFKMLPKSPLALSSSHGRIGWAELGYDAMTNDFKVVQARLNDPFVDFGITGPPVELYKLSTNSWEILSVDSELVTPLRNRCCMVEGCLWWPMMDYVVANVKHRLCSFSLLRFDLNSEVFRKIMPPEHLQGVRDEVDIPESSILALGKRVALILYELGDLTEERCFDIWAMEESGVDVSWSKVLSIGPIPGYEPVAFWGNNRFLLLQYIEGVILYELSTQKIKHFKLNVGSQDFSGCQIIVYRDSLLKIGN